MHNNIKTITENTINWALEYLGKKDYVFKCLGFVNHALGHSNNIEISITSSAKQAAETYSADTSTGTPPRGSFVFYSSTGIIKGVSKNWGHVGLALDDGRVIHAWDVIRINDYREIETLKSAPGWTAPKYIGWVSIEKVLEINNYNYTCSNKDNTIQNTL